MYESERDSPKVGEKIPCFVGVMAARWKKADGGGRRRMDDFRVRTVWHRGGGLEICRMMVGNQKSMVGYALSTALYTLLGV